MNHLQIDDYYYGVRIFPGQDPAQVWVGWVTPQYHYHSSTFDADAGVRKCRFSEIDHRGAIVDRFIVDSFLIKRFLFYFSVEYRSCYMMNAADLLAAVSDAANTKVAGLLIGCIIDTSIGELSFNAAGQDTGYRFKVLLCLNHVIRIAVGTWCDAISGCIRDAIECRNFTI